MSKSSKNELQEYCDGMQWDHPRYDTIEENQNFTVRAEVRRGNQDMVSATGEHIRKKEAGKIAAKLLLEKLKAGSPGDVQTPDEGVEGGDMSEQVDDEMSQGATPLNSSPWSNLTSKAKNFINYRSQVNQYCQQNNLILIHDNADNIHSLTRFSTKISIQGHPYAAVGSGDSKKEANEVAAKELWTKMQPLVTGSSKHSPHMQIPPEILHTDPVTIGIQRTTCIPPSQLGSNLDENPDLLIEPTSKPIGPINTNNDDTDNINNDDTDNINNDDTDNINNNDTDNINNDDTNNSEQNVPANGDYVQALNEKFSNMIVQFVPIPFEGVKTEEHFYFVSVREQGEIPFVAGHGKGFTDEEARNAAAKDCLGLYVDPESEKKFKDCIDSTKFD